MFKKKFTNNPLFLVFFIPIIVDVVGTVLGQPPEFWTTGGEVFSEALPIYPLLQFSPVLFIIFCLATWLPITYWLTLKLKFPLNIWATMAIFAGHSYNSVAWLRINLRHANIFAGSDQLSQALGLIPMTIYILFIGYIGMRGIIQYFYQKKHESLNRMSPKLTSQH